MILPFTFNDLSKAFSKNDILSVDIGFTNIKVVHARKKSHNNIKVLNFGIGTTPSGCIKNGIISDLDGIAEQLRKVVHEQKISEKNVKIVISAGSNIISKVIFVEKTDGKKIEEKIREEIMRQSPLDIYSQKLFYRITGELENETGSYYKVLVTVVPNSTIDNYVKLIKLLNFKPVSIEIPFSSVARFFSKGVKIIVKEDRSYRYFNREYAALDDRATAVVDLGSETTNLSILNNGALEFNRIILTGGRGLDEVIAKKLSVKREVAERYKKMHGIVTVRHIGDEIEQIVDECVRNYIGEILNNVKRSIEFYVSRCGGDAIERVFFIGGGSGIKGLKEFAGEILGVPVYTLDMMEFDNIEFEDNLDKDKVRFLINAIGIAM